MLWIAVIAGIFLLEYFMKNHMDHILPFQEQRPLFGGRMVLKKHYNTGAAGNFLSSRPKAMQRMHIAALSLAAGALALVAAFPSKYAAAVKTGLSFLTGGGLSNLYDRMAKGHVVDYVSFGFGPKRFQKLVFNMADFFVFAGVLICSAAILVADLKKKK